MNKELKQHLAKSVFEAMNQKNFSDFENNITENLVFDFPGSGRIEGSKRVILFFNALLRKYSKLIFDVSEVIVDEDRACAVWTNSGELKDGTIYANSGITLFYFIDDKMSFISDYFKDTSFTQAK